MLNVFFTIQLAGYAWLRALRLMMSIARAFDKTMEQGMEPTVISTQTHTLISTHPGVNVMQRPPLRTAGIGRAQARAS